MTGIMWGDSISWSSAAVEADRAFRERAITSLAIGEITQRHALIGLPIFLRNRLFEGINEPLGKRPNGLAWILQPFDERGSLLIERER